MATRTEHHGPSGRVYIMKCNRRTIWISEPKGVDGVVDDRRSMVIAKLTPRGWLVRDATVRWRFHHVHWDFEPPAETWQTFVGAVVKAYGIQIPDGGRPSWL